MRQKKTGNRQRKRADLSRKGNAEQIEKAKYKISRYEPPQKTDVRRIKTQWNIATVRKAAASLKEHPLYYTDKRIPLLNRMLPEYIREYGPDSILQKQILKYSGKSGQITLLRESDNKTAKMLLASGYANVICRDFDKKRVEKKRHVDPGVPIQFCTEVSDICSAGKMIVCANRFHPQ